MFYGIVDQYSMSFSGKTATYGADIVNSYSTMTIHASCAEELTLRGGTDTTVVLVALLQTSFLFVLLFMVSFGLL